MKLLLNTPLHGELQKEIFRVVLNRPGITTLDCAKEVAKKDIFVDKEASVRSGIVVMYKKGIVSRKAIAYQNTKTPIYGYTIIGIPGEFVEEALPGIEEKLGEKKKEIKDLIAFIDHVKNIIY